MDKRTEDIEMAITGLKGIATILEPLLLAANYEGLGKDDVKELRGHLNMAAKALEKQMPQKPITVVTEDDDIDNCGICGCIFGAAGHFDLWDDEYPLYCHNCGQKIDWG